MKKVLILFLTVILILPVFAGCAETPADTTEAETVPVSETVTETAEETTDEETTEEETETETETEPVTYGEFTVEPDETAELTVSNVFGDSMVLQRDAKITVWGTSNKDGATVRGLFMDDEARAEVADGKWEITFAAKEMTKEPQVMTIEDSCGNSIAINDILIGDVWIIGGQSNAEATATHLPDVKQYIKVDENRLLRILHQSADDVIGNRKEAKEPRDTLINSNRKWVKETKSSIGNVTLLGLFLGERLTDDTGIPIGIISVAANGAKINEFMPKELVDEFKYRLGGNVGPSEYYNALVNPFIRIKFKAMVFFQGESEAFNNANPTPKKYARDLLALFSNWRGKWGFDFPIYNIQLSDYTAKALSGMPNTGYIRSQQYNAYTSMEGVRLIPSYDLGAMEGYWNYMHSPKKKELANRVADLALAEQYGIGSVNDALAPEPETVTLSADKTYVTVKFKNVGTGLVSYTGDNTFAGFTFGQINLPSKHAAATGEIISEDTVRINIPEGIKLTGIGYACQPHVTKADCQLFNSNGLPSLAFYYTLQ